VPCAVFAFAVRAPDRKKRLAAVADEAPRKPALGEETRPALRQWLTA
jgi:hypothetical protein